MKATNECVCIMLSVLFVFEIAHTVIYCHNVLYVIEKVSMHMYI